MAGLSWRTILAFGLLGLILGFGWGIADQPVYRATAGVAVESDSQGADQARLERFAQRGEGEAVATKSAGLLGGDVAGADLLADVVVRPAQSGGALIVTASSESPDYAAAAADGYADALVTVEGDPLALGATAAIPSNPYQNRSAPLSAALGLLAGLVLGLIVAVTVSVAGRRRDADPARPTGLPGAPFLGRLGDRAVASRLGLRPHSTPGSIGITSVGNDAAAADAALLVAGDAAAMGLRVLLVEADLARPELAGRLGVAPQPGLHDYLEGAASPQKVLRSVRADAARAGVPVEFTCLPAGDAGGDPSIGRSRFADLVGQLAKVYDVVFYTFAPVLAGDEVEALADLMDGVVVVVGAEASDPELASAGEALRTARVAGVITCEA